MLHKYECEHCGSVCYTESEVWESCPICEETPDERKMRERAEQVEQERDRLREERDCYRQTLIDLLQEVEPFTSLSKHLKREYMEAQELLESKK